MGNCLRMKVTPSMCDDDHVADQQIRQEEVAKRATCRDVDERQNKDRPSSSKCHNVDERKNRDRPAQTSSSPAAAPELEPENGDKKEVKKTAVDAENVKGSNEGEVGGKKIRIVVTRAELKQILSLKEEMKYNSLEQLLRIVRLRSRRRIYRSCWKPTLATIPENYSFS